MQSYDVTKMRMRHVVPFELSYDADFEELCSLIDNHKDDPYAFMGNENEGGDHFWRRVSLSHGEQDLYKYIVDEFAAPVDSKVRLAEKSGVFWSYQSDTGKNDVLKLSAKLPGREESVRLRIKEMGLYVFRSGVGFLWYELYIDEKKLPDSVSLIEFQYKIKELNLRSADFIKIDSDLVTWPREAGMSGVIPFSLGNWVACRLAFLNVRYQASRRSHYSLLLNKASGNTLDHNRRRELGISFREIIPDKALLFNYFAFRTPCEFSIDDEDAARTVYYLTKGYKESYVMSSDVPGKMHKPFGNVLWMATREGAGYYAWYDESNRAFFVSNQYNKVMNDYFLMYIKAIYQSYSLMRYAVRTSKMLPDRLNEYLQISDETEIISEKITRLCTELDLFMIKSVTTSVSHIHHQNDFYSYICRQLSIKEDIMSVTSGLNSLNELQQMKVQKKREKEDAEDRALRRVSEEREKQSDKNFQTGLGIVTFLVVISALTDTYGLVDSIINGALKGPGLAVFCAVAGLCVISFVWAIWLCLFSVRIKRRQKSRKDR